MSHTGMARWVLAAASAVAAMALTQESAPGDGPGWTGASNAEDVIVARQALMTEIEQLMQPIDIATTGDSFDPDELEASARSIAAMLLAVPHLFPPTTNLYDPADETPPTIALPAIWDDFATFYTLAGAASTAASDMASIAEPDALPDAARRLRGSCDACHALYLRPYVPRKVTSEDLEFDFDSVFPDKD